MKHYQQGFLAGLKKESASNNHLRAMAIEFIAGEKAKASKANFTKKSWAETSLTFREGYKSSEFAHLASKGNMLKTGNDEWAQGHTSGLNKANNVLAEHVHSAAFKVVVSLNAINQDAYEPFVQSYTFEDHQNEVYIIEARHRHGLTSIYPREHVINSSPCLTQGLSLDDIEQVIGQTVLISTHNILQATCRSYQPITIKGVNFLMRTFEAYTKLALNIPKWNEEAKKQVTWELELPTFPSL